MILNGILSPVEGSVGATKPILRRDTISAAEEGGTRDGESNVSKVPECDEQNVSNQPPLRRRPSALTFAVNPCPPMSPRSINAQYNQRTRSRSTSTSISQQIFLAPPISRRPLSSSFRHSPPHYCPQFSSRFPLPEVGALAAQLRVAIRQVPS